MSTEALITTLVQFAMFTFLFGRMTEAVKGLREVVKGLREKDSGLENDMKTLAESMNKLTQDLAIHIVEHNGRRRKSA